MRFPLDPRDVPPDKAARRLGLTRARFDDLLPRLRARGFPAPDPDTGNFDLKVIDAWMDARSGLAFAREAEDASLGFGERLRALGGKGGRR